MHSITHPAYRSRLLAVALTLVANASALAFDTTPPAPFSAASCAPMQRKFFVIRLQSTQATRTLTFNKGAGLVIFKGTAEKDLKWTMPLSDFTFTAPADAAAPGVRVLTAVHRGGDAFAFGSIDDACWSRLRKYGSGAMSFG